MSGIDIKPDAQGKVRDLYDLGDKLLLVASDRISAFDYILEDEIPYKGQVLTQLSCFWFELLDGVIENHLISADVKDLPEQFKPYEDYLRGRFMLVKKADMFPVECIVRGYLAGSGLKEYEREGTVCGIELPQGLVNSSKLPKPPSSRLRPRPRSAITTRTSASSARPSLSATRRLRRCATCRSRCTPRLATMRPPRESSSPIRNSSSGAWMARSSSADEVLTPDSSRFWAVDDRTRKAKEQPSFDKQFVRNWLNDNWDRTGNPPRLPQDVIEKTSEKYIQAYETHYRAHARKFRLRALVRCAEVARESGSDATTTSTTSRSFTAVELNKEYPMNDR